LIEADGVARAKLTETKGAAGTEPCSLCRVTKAQLSDHRYDVNENPRTTATIVETISNIEAEVGKAARTALSQQLGVVLQGLPNPLHYLHFDVNQMPMERFHQDAEVRVRDHFHYLIAVHCT
jgi:hypothetical protein